MTDGLTVHDQWDLRSYTTLGLPARAAYFVSVTSPEALVAALARAAAADWPVYFLGGGSNIVLAGDVPGLVIHLAWTGCHVVSESSEGEIVVEAAAGHSWHDFVLWTLDQGWAGLENLALIPGTVGAAPIQNIGAYGVELSDRLVAVQVWDRVAGATHWLPAEACALGYRDSVFKSGAPGRYVVLAIRCRVAANHPLQLGYGDLARAVAERAGDQPPTARQVAEAVMAIRQSKLPDPAHIGNAGSFFKNPVVSADQAAQLRARYPALVAHPQPDGHVKLAAGWLLDHAGWQGHRAGAVGVHDRQALVLVHTGGGTGSALLALAAKIQADVAQRYGVHLEQEPVIWPTP